MLRILRSEIYNGLMQALFLVSLYELIFGNGHIDSGVILIALFVSSMGALLGFLASGRSTAKRKR
jgi:hypothetical protein